jgi:hypothetical protein
MAERGPTLLLVVVGVVVPVAIAVMVVLVVALMLAVRRVRRALVQPVAVLVEGFSTLPFSAQAVSLGVLVAVVWGFTAEVLPARVAFTTFPPAPQAVVVAEAAAQLRLQQQHACVALPQAAYMAGAAAQVGLLGMPAASVLLMALAKRGPTVHCVSYTPAQLGLSQQRMLHKSWTTTFFFK